MKSREEIIKYIVDAAKLSSRINAVFEIGAVAFNRVDEYSDIDLVFDVEGEYFEESFDLIEDTLKEIAPIKSKIGAPNGISKGAYQVVYSLEGYSEFLVIEICFIPSTSKKPIEKEIHGDIIIHFDKKGVLKGHININEFGKAMSQRFKRIKKLVNMYQFSVKKEIERNNPTEAYFYYFGVTLNPFIELIRMRYNPFRYNFRHRYLYIELPIEIAKEIEEFTFIKDIKDLKLKHTKIINRINEEIEYLDSIDFIEHLNNYKKNDS